MTHKIILCQIIDILMSIINSLFSPQSLCLRLGRRAKISRLEHSMSRRELSERSGVADSTIRRFENTGEIGTSALIMVLGALGLTDQVEALFQKPPPKTTEDVLRQPRKYGKRSDAGKKRTDKPTGEKIER